MRRVVYQVTHCPFCNRQISLESPPSNKRYERAEVHVADLSSVLLPSAVVKAKEEAGLGNSHAASLDGYYCNPECLSGYIKRLLEVEPKRKKRAA